MTLNRNEQLFVFFEISCTYLNITLQKTRLACTLVDVSNFTVIRGCGSWATTL